MVKYIIMILGISMAAAMPMHSFAQKNKKDKKNEPTAEQLGQYRMALKQMLLDSLPMTPPQADTTAAIEVDYQQKLLVINGDKKMDKDERDMRIGMLDEGKENRLRYLLPGSVFEKYMAMQRRRKEEYERRQKEAKDAQNQQMSNMNNGMNRGGYGGGYGGYGRGY